MRAIFFSLLLVSGLSSLLGGEPNLEIINYKENERVCCSSDNRPKSWKKFDCHSRKKRGKRGPTGGTGPVGPTGGTGPVGPTGLNGLGAETVYFSTFAGSLQTNTTSFSLFWNVVGGGLGIFDPSTTLSPNFNYSPFLVPFDGEISNLTIRMELGASESVSLDATFTIYQSIPTSEIGTSGSLGSWTATTLVKSTGVLMFENGDHATMVFQNLDDVASVSAGAMLIVVVNLDTYTVNYAIQPARLSASFKYTPSNN